MRFIFLLYERGRQVSIQRCYVGSLVVRFLCTFLIHHCSWRFCLSSRFSACGIGIAAVRSGFQEQRGWKGSINELEITRNLTQCFQLYPIGQNPANGHTPSFKEGNAEMDFKWTHFYL